MDRIIEVKPSRPDAPTPGFTPGPWYAYSPLASGVHAGHHYKVANSKPCGIVEDEDGSWVPDFPDWCAESRIICTTTDDEFSRANARLIAAAPEGYHAVVGLLNAIHDSMTHESQRFHSDAIDAALAYLAKAGGK